MPIACAHCRTELSPDALACPACGALIHADRLKAVAVAADAAVVAGDAASARTHWTEALSLLPPESQQHTAVRNRIASLTRELEADAPPSGTTSAGKRGWWRGAAGLASVALMLLGKLKFLLLGLTKASTFMSMFAFFGVYWSVYGWPLALGLVLSIYVHEMGHVAMLRSAGIDSSAPMFIPGVGALVMLKQHVADPRVDAKIGLAGPVWGLGAGLVAAAVYAVTRAPIWFAIAQLTGFINLFNLIPIWQLDGSRGFHALSRPERWALVAAVVLALLVTEQRLLFLIGGAAVWRALQREEGPGDTRALAIFLVLIFALSLLARGVR